MKRAIPILIAVALAAAGLVLLLVRDAQPDSAAVAGGERKGTPVAANGRPALIAAPPEAAPARSPSADGPAADGPAERKTPEELRKEAEEAQVEAFDALTDKWMEPSEKGVSMADVDGFAAQFRKLPKDRREECLQRALNLVPDENVMLLAGILMDKSQPKELVELVFNDILNRDEDVKKPILTEIFKDKSHPCWADTAWILDVTGEKP